MRCFVSGSWHGNTESVAFSKLKSSNHGRLRRVITSGVTPAREPFGTRVEHTLAADFARRSSSGALLHSTTSTRAVAGRLHRIRLEQAVSRAARPLVVAGNENPAVALKSATAGCSGSLSIVLATIRSVESAGLHATPLETGGQIRMGTGRCGRVSLEATPCDRERFGGLA